jgi:hypothetical protein
MLIYIPVFLILGENRIGAFFSSKVRNPMCATLLQEKKAAGQWLVAGSNFMAMVVPCLESHS